MDSIKAGFRLLALFSGFFLYKIIMGIIANNPNETTLWSMITIIYVVSLAISYFIFTRWEKRKGI
ncbi:MAG: hypothetical protein ACFFDB_05190 [Promethearchaeota archaeon]